MLTPHCSAASGMVVPPSIVPTTRLRRSAEYGFAMPAGLLPADSLNHIRAAMGIPDSAFSGNALVVVGRGRCNLKAGYLATDRRAGLSIRETRRQYFCDIRRRKLAQGSGDHPQPRRRGFGHTAKSTGPTTTAERSGRRQMTLGRAARFPQQRLG